MKPQLYYFAKIFCSFLMQPPMSRKEWACKNKWFYSIHQDNNVFGYQTHSTKEDESVLL